MQKTNQKIDTFLQEYGDLVKKHNVDFATYPVFTPDGQGGFRIVCQSTPVDLDEMKKARESFTGK